MARGMLAAVAIATLLVVSRMVVGEAPAARPEPPPDCKAPVQVEEGAGSRVGCAGDPSLAPCGRLAAGDRVRLESGGCRRRDGGMQASLRVIYGLRIDVNRATADDLELLDGIGPRLARAIVAERAAHGPFAEVADLRRVRGIGPALLERLAPVLAAEGPPADVR